MSKDDNEFNGHVDVEKLTQALSDLCRKKALDAAMAMGYAQGCDYCAELVDEMLEGSAKHMAPPEPKAVAPSRSRHRRRSKTVESRIAAVKQPALNVLQRWDGGFIQVDEILKQLGWEGDEARKSVLNALDQEYRAGRLDKRSPNKYRVIPLGEVQS